MLVANCAFVWRERTIPVFMAPKSVGDMFDKQTLSSERLRLLAMKAWMTVALVVANGAIAIFIRRCCLIAEEDTVLSLESCARSL